MCKFKDYYTVRDVAYLCGVSETCVRRWIRDGKLKAKLMGDIYDVGCQGGAGWMIPRDQLEYFDPIDNAISMGQLNRCSKEHETQEYIDWLDRRTEQLYREIEMTNKIKEYIREIGPYL